MTSQQPFKFRHLDSIIGVFVLGTVAVVIAAILLVGHARQWFTWNISTITAATPFEKDAARNEFLEELSESLRPGTPVEMSGQVVGQVKSARSEDGRLLMELSVANSALAEMYYGSSRAVIKVPLAPFMGQTRVLIKPGHKVENKQVFDKGWPHKDGEPLPIEPPRDSTAMAMAVLRDLEANLDPLLSGITSTLAETRGLLADVRSQKLPERAAGLLDDVRAQKLPERTAALIERADSIAAQVEKLVAGIAAGKGVAGKMLGDEALAADLAGIAADLRAITAQLKLVAPAAPGLTQGAESLLEDVRRMVDGLNRHWLLRSYTTPADPTRLPPNGMIPPPAQEAGAKP